MNSSGVRSRSVSSKASPTNKIKGVNSKTPKINNQKSTKSPTIDKKFAEYLDKKEREKIEETLNKRPKWNGQKKETEKNANSLVMIEENLTEFLEAIKQNEVQVIDTKENEIANNINEYCKNPLFYNLNIGVKLKK